nr:phosphoribosylformylglycinamidine synthase [uncultured Lachnoanaerobaculum sp.]
MGVRRIYVEKKPDFAIRAKELSGELRSYLGLKNLDDVRVLVRYDIENISDEDYKKSLGTIFCEPPLDICFESKFSHLESDFYFTVEYLPGQFDQRADSAIQCVKLLGSEDDINIRSATTYIFSGRFSEADKERIRDYCINPVDSRIADESIPETLKTDFEMPKDVESIEGFITMDEKALKDCYESLSLAMTFDDFKFIQGYLKNDENRNPSVTEIRVLDTYWSDHCRHTTFSTQLKDVSFEEGFFGVPAKESYERYLNDRKVLYKDKKNKKICLMDIALLAMKKLKADNILTDVEESDEINACSIVVPILVDGKKEEWLINFKNETHNHPTEIEPFGGAATCLGGAIRDPLSGRTYVYQAMRITGAADPTLSIEKTMQGKLPQRKIVTGAAHGYSSYGNQIGLATGYVKEIYHPNYVAKRMEIGAVMGAAKRANVIRKTSDPGDIIVLLGGRTGRDGIGGATGSSKVHKTDSIMTAGAEVQKGNAPTERKIQRLFKRPEVTILIKKCNDFGAGGVSVAIGELADGLIIDLDKVPKKYAGLDGTELAISESQERMAVVLAPESVEEFCKYAEEENLETSIVAKVLEEKRLQMTWRGKTIVDLSRAFLDTNGATSTTDVYVKAPNEEKNPFKYQNTENNIEKRWLETVSDLNVASQKGLVEMFDSSIGGKSVLMPYGGKYQLSETQSMVAKLPLLDEESDAVTIMSYGFDPYLSSWSPYHGAMYAIVSSLSKIVAAGGDYKKVHFTFQEYFRRMTDSSTWGEPLSALLGAYEAQMKLGLASIGGKDSMSGTFNDINVPPTLVSFAVVVGDNKNIISTELKKVRNKLYFVKLKRDKYDLPDFEYLKRIYSDIQTEITNKKIVSAFVLERNGIAEAVSKMCFGNMLGVSLKADEETLFAPEFGGFLLESESELHFEGAIYLGEVIKEPKVIVNAEEISLDKILKNWKKPLESVFPSVEEPLNKEVLEDKIYRAESIYIAKEKNANPKVFIPVMPGTNCEYDSIRAFRRAGASAEAFVFRNSSPLAIKESVEQYKNEIRNSQIIMFPGGFSAGDEPDGSAKFFATVFRNEILKKEIGDLLGRDGLILGICNGFQTLIKLGLLPDGKIKEQEELSATLATNTIGRHISKMAYLKTVSNKSPWLMNAKLGDVYANPVSHGEGRFVAPKEKIDELFKNGQVATRYVDLNGNPTMCGEYNPNGSYAAIEGITSPDGRIFGKMAHSERRENGVAINVFEKQDLQIFESGVKYFR